VFLHLRGFASTTRWTLRFWRGQFWEWTGTQYDRLEAPDLRGQVTEAVKREFHRVAEVVQAAKKKSDDGEKAHVLYVTRSVVSDVIQALQGMVLVPASVEQPTWFPPKSDCHNRYIAMTNGLVDVDALVAGDAVTPVPHTPDWFSPTCLPYAYDPAALCPRWARVADDAMESDTERIRVLQEWFGYCLVHDTSQQKFLVIYGDGGTGKTVTLDVLTALLGPANVSHIPVEQFDKRFQLTPTIGMLANIATEVGEVSRGGEAVLKAFTSGDRMYFDRKGLSGIQALPTARLALAANNLPRFADRSSGIWRRIVLVPYRVVIPEAQQDPHLLDALLTELAGVFNWSVVGLRRLQAQGHFTQPAVCREALDAYRTDSNPARAFLLEFAYLDPKSRWACLLVYEGYRVWCHEHGHPPLDASQFGKEVARSFPEVTRKRGPRTDGSQPRPYYYVGLALHDGGYGPLAGPAHAPAPAATPRASSPKRRHVSQVT
jgi:P4 family phage/plasmid primase-like protien